LRGKLGIQGTQLGPGLTPELLQVRLLWRSAACASMSVYPVRAVSLCINNSVFSGKWRRETNPTV